MDSFYGGNPGFSFIIVKSYLSVKEMSEDFKLGANFSAVHYNEHVLINTENKNDPDNGKIFRRGYNYKNELGGAEYIGTIVGPSGRAPMLEMTTIEEVNNKQASEGFDYRKGSGEYAPLENLVPGKTEDGSFNDSIEWAYCSIRNENDEDCTAYIGFKFPYTVIEFSAESVSPYYNRSDQTENFINQNLTEREDDKTHPYYTKWHFNIPKGIKGDTLKDFRVIDAIDDIEDYSGKDDDVLNQRKILVYDYYKYDKDEGGEPVSIYVGDYNMIDLVDLDEEGTLTIKVSHDDDFIFSKAIKWIKEITLNKQNGKFTVVYNHETDVEDRPTTYTTDLSWINEVNLSEDGTLTFTYTTGENETFDKKIKWIKNIVLNQDGSIVVSYNNGETKTLERALKFITRTFIETEKDSLEEGTGDQKLHIIYNTGEEEIVGNPINYILETAITPNDFHYIVRYSDPVKRQQIVSSGKNYTYQGKNDWLDLGSVKEDSGILIGLNLSPSEIPQLSSNDAIIKYLNSTYPNGLQGVNLQGKVVSVGDKDSDKKFFAFDYDKKDGVYNGWYYIGNFNASVDMSKIFMINKESDSDYNTNQKALDIGGIWFVVED